MATRGGAADSYYQNAPNNPAPMQYSPQSSDQQPQYQQSPPNYDQKYQEPTNGPQMEGGAGGKQTWDQAFKLDKPKYNDLWAGILVVFPIIERDIPFPMSPTDLMHATAHHNLPWFRWSLRPLDLRLQQQ